jgi:hypothetical protein
MDGYEIKAFADARNAELRRTVRIKQQRKKSRKK